MRTLREQIAALCHEQWSNWMKHLFQQTRPTFCGDEVIPAEFVNRWRQQMETHYDELSEPEKDSDRRGADRFLAVLGKHGPQNPINNPELGKLADQDTTT